jgi:two-component system, sensor histidine kinase
MSGLITAPVSNSEAETEELMQRRFSLMAAQVASLRWTFLMVIIVVIAVAWNAVPKPLLLGWFFISLLVFALRMSWLNRHAKLTQEPAAQKVKRAVMWNALLGLMLGASALFMLWLDQTLSAVLTTIIVSTAAGAVAISGPLLPVYLAYTLGIMLPFAAMWSAQGGALGFGLAVLMATFVLLQYRFARKVNDTFTESFLIRRENEHLIGQLTQARDEATSANRAKTRFLAAASHDLRQPLHALSLQASALLIDPHASDTPQIAADISKQIEDVSTLLDSLLDISKLDAGTLAADKRPIHLSRLLDSLAKSFGQWVEAKGLRFVFHNSPDQVAVTDPVLIERILRNLVDNAIKFTSAGQITMSLEKKGGMLELSVTDSGVGIAPELQARVFEEFYQIERHALGHQRGLGLGLSIVSRLSGLLGMGVQLSSSTGQGTTVCLQMPVDPAAPVPTASPVFETLACDLRGVRVLVLDDEPAICTAMTTLLRRLGCEALSANTIAEARSLAESFGPRVLLADYRLEDDYNGVDAVAQLRADHPQILALLISGDTAPERLREADASGLCLLHKPVSLGQLKQALSTLVSTGT